MAGSFFRPAVARHVRLALPDRLLVQPRDLRDQAHPTVPQPVRLDGGVPAPFSLAEPTQQQVHLLMEPPVGVRFPGQARPTLADPDVDRTHGWHPDGLQSVLSC
jgi:hypothetical protein